MEEDLRQLMNAGRKHFEAGEYTEAETCITRVLHQESGFADLLNMLGVIYHDQGRSEEAEKAFEKALAINPNYTDAALNLSITYNDRGKYQEAREIYSRAINNSYKDDAQVDGLDPFARGKISNMHSELGDAYYGLGLFEDAVREFERALTLSPDFVDIRTKLGHVYRDMGRSEEAIEQYRQVKKEKANYLPARLAPGVTLFSVERKEEAIAEWQECVSLAPTDKRAATYLRMMSAQDRAAKPGSSLDD
jgi:tetratricopeptide (TPR) repeat protein